MEFSSSSQQGSYKWKIPFPNGPIYREHVKGRRTLPLPDLAARLRRPFMSRCRPVLGDRLLTLNRARKKFARSVDHLASTAICWRMKNTPYQIAAWSALAAIVFVTVSPVQMRPGDVFSVDADRALAFCLLATSFMVAYPRHAGPVGMLVVAGASLIELLQFLSPSRHARIDDAVVKAIGAAGGMVLASAYNFLRSARHLRSNRRFQPPQTQSQCAASLLSDGMISLPVRSNMIHAVYFGPEDGKLHIRMHNGEVRLFQGVSQDDVDLLVKAPSPGRHYVEQIRTKFQRVAA